MVKGSRVTWCTYEKVAVAGIACCLLLGLRMWSEHRLQHRVAEDRHPMNLLQTQTGGHRQSLRQNKGPQCPAKLLEQYKDCRVVQARNNIKVGRHGAKPQDSQHSILMYSALDSSALPAGPRSVVGWRPVMQETKSTCPGEDKSVSLVHHVNVYGYMSDFPLAPGKTYSSQAAELGRMEDAYNRMVASHDKEAGEYILPPGYGIGADDPMYVETHLLFPKCWTFDEDILESSGLDLYVTSQASMKPAGLVGALNFNMDVQPGSGRVDYVTRIDADHLRKIFPVQAGGSALQLDQEMPEILAMHLHTHDVAEKKFFEVLNPDGSVHFRSKEEKAGYGLLEQSFISPEEKGWGRLKLQQGQQLQQHCTFDTSHLQSHVHYGLDWGEEMCAPLMVVGGSKLARTQTLLSGTDSWVVLLGRSLRAAIQDVIHEMHRLV